MQVKVTASGLYRGSRLLESTATIPARPGSELGMTLRYSHLVPGLVVDQQVVLVHPPNASGHGVRSERHVRFLAEGFTHEETVGYTLMDARRPPQVGTMRQELGKLRLRVEIGNLLVAEHSFEVVAPPPNDPR